MPTDQHEDTAALLQKFRSAASGRSDSSRLNYHKAINCLETFLGTYSYSSAFPSPQTLADWYLNMKVRGFSQKTSVHYLDIISALYRDTASETDPSSPNAFGVFKARVKELAKATQPACPIDDATFKRILTATRPLASQPKILQRAADILRYSLLHRAMPLAGVALTKASDVNTDSDAMAEIVRRNASPTRKYLFPLDQSRLTPRQLEESVRRMVRALILAKNIPLAGTADDTIRLIWACAALKCGIPGSEILTLLGQPVAAVPGLSLCVGADLSPERSDALSDTVNALFSDNPPRWYAMKLRTRVTFGDIKRRVSELDDSIVLPEFFYPLDEICLRVGKKVVRDTHPVIKDIVFFKLRVTDIFPLFCRIGDLAWCYTTTGRPGGDYAPIPRRSFDLFQETIGHFTPDYEIAPIGGFTPEEGETVVIINGPLASYEFEVDKAADSENVIYQLNMVGSNGFQWRTSAPRRHLRKKN